MFVHYLKINNINYKLIRAILFENKDHYICKLYIFSDIFYNFIGVLLSSNDIKGNIELLDSYRIGYKN